MIKVGVADFGLNVWDGALYDYNDRLAMIKRAGFDGIERLEAKNQTEAIEISANARSMGLDFGTCRGNCAAETLRWSAALGKKYIWVESQAGDFDIYCRQVNKQVEVASGYGVRVGLHNHLGLTVETEEQVLRFIENCPDCGLILDVGHLAAAGGDPLYIIEHFSEKLVAVHLKDYVYKDKNAKNWWDRLRFCELGAGEMGDLNAQIITRLLEKEYDGWVYIEHDTHLREPEIDLKTSREYMRRYGI